MSTEPPRRSSLGMLLRRSKSGDLKGGRKVSKEQHQQQPRQDDSVSRIPPKLPDFVQNNEQLSNSFGTQLASDSSPPVARSSDFQSGRASMEPGRYAVHNVAIPPIPADVYDPYARTESMTHRGRYSYASSAVSTVNNPRRVRRRRDPTPFNILVIGARGSGKTSFLEFLKTALAPPPKKRSKRSFEDEERPNKAIPNGNFVPQYLETEIDDERVGLTLWDSEGLEKNVVDLQLREMSAFLESKFEETFTEEMKVVRSPGVQDTHIHAAFLLLDPARLDRNLSISKSSNGFGSKHRSRLGNALDEDVDLQVLRALKGKTTVIPVISKADTITTKHMAVLKKSIWNCIKKTGLDPLEPLGLDDEDGENGTNDSRIDEEADEDADSLDSVQTRDDDDLPIQGREDAFGSPNSKRLSSNSIRRHKALEDSKEDDLPFLPLSTISPDLYEPDVVGRQFPWGFADPYNEEHCDFVRLKEAVFSEWRAELREASREQWYEGWRTSRLNTKEVPYRRR